MFSLSKSDRVLIVAPHPDDESLGAGGLLQRLFAQKIPVRILFATNGENNAWAQRYWDKRLLIGPEERVRWGKRRREEALSAISALGGKHACAKFMNLPDQGLTRLLMLADPDLSVRLADEIQEWEPTVAIIPTMHDAHPDHSALSVAFSLALDSIGGSLTRIWEYLVHKPQVQLAQEPVKLLLSLEEMERKRRAILCHETQVALSRRRFTGFATITEAYFPHDPVDAKMWKTPLAAARLHEGVLSLTFEAGRRERFHSKILLILRSSAVNGHCFMLPLPLASGPSQIWDTIRGQRLDNAIVQWRGSTLFVDLPIAGTPDFDSIYAKISGWTLFFDRSGWHQMPVRASREQSFARRTRAPRLATPL
jgi:LmbE family N-acetylglucosaminyl deacetylase